MESQKAVLEADRDANGQYVAGVNQKRMELQKEVRNVGLSFACEVFHTLCELPAERVRGRLTPSEITALQCPETEASAIEGEAEIGR